MKLFRMSCWVMTLLVVAAVNLPVWAQPVTEAKDSGSWIATVFAIVLCIGVAVGSFTGSRRGHQD